MRLKIALFISLIFCTSLFVSGQQYSTGKATLGEPIDSIKSNLGPSFRFESHPLSDPSIVVTIAIHGADEAYLLESLNNIVFFIHHQAYSNTGYNAQDIVTSLTSKYGAISSKGNYNSLFWGSTLIFGRSCIGYGPAGFPWPSGNLTFIVSVKPGSTNTDCRAAAEYIPLELHMGTIVKLPPGYIPGIDVRLVDPSIALPEFIKLSAQQQQKQKDVEQKARQNKPPL